MDKRIITVLGFTDFPGARYRTDGDGSAQEFFEEFVKPVLDETSESDQEVLIDFDNTYGYASSFESELAVRIAKDYDSSYIRTHLKLKSDDEPDLINRFWTEYEKGLAD